MNPTHCRASSSTGTGRDVSCRSARPGWSFCKPQITEALLQVVACETLIYKNDGASRELEGLPAYVEAAKGRLESAGEVHEGGLKFKVPLAEGQKTGWFFDQAANRAALTRYVQKGARVLDVFSYVGAWGVRAARDGAAEVTCIDSSAAALELAAENAELQLTEAQDEQGRRFRRAGIARRARRRNSTS